LSYLAIAKIREMKDFASFLEPFLGSFDLLYSPQEFLLFRKAIHLSLAICKKENRAKSRIEFKNKQPDLPPSVPLPA